MSKYISLIGALTRYLNEKHINPIVSMYDLGKIMFLMYEKKAYETQIIKKINLPTPNKSLLSKSRNELIEEGVLKRKVNLPHNLSILSSSPYKSAEDIICSVDPFCYISHLSAMAFHGISDRIPKVVFTTTYTPKEWKTAAQNRMKKDLGDNFEIYIQNKFPILTKHSVTSIAKKTINSHASKNFGSYIVIRDSSIRVSSIGKTFLDMLRKPDICGGMSHVVNVFEESAETYLDLVVDEINLHGNDIEKVRAGYILNERCGIQNNEIIESWQSQIQRGGSRKLDPNEPYWDIFSKKWCLSINVNI